MQLVCAVIDKRRKDIQTVSGIRVDETGIGNGQVCCIMDEIFQATITILLLLHLQESVPIESGRRDRFFVPIITVSTLTLAVLVAVMAIQQIREYRKKMRKLNNEEFESQKYGDNASNAYENLCRYQMGSQEVTGATDTHINNAGSTSWFVSLFIPYRKQKRINCLS